MPKKNFSQLEKAILASVCYYDIFDYPLTPEEIWRWLYFKDNKNEAATDLNVVIEALEMSDNLKDFIDEAENYFFLRGRREIVETRKERYEADQKKWKIAKQVTKLIRISPFLKYVAVCNNLAINNARKNSDIDFFIVAEAGHIFTTRLSVTLLTSLLGRRRTSQKIKDHVCLSFYVTDNMLDFRPLMLPGDDPYFTFWLNQLGPLFDKDDLHNKIKAANNWAKSFMPNAFISESEPLVKVGKITSFFQNLFEAILRNPLIGQWWEGFFRGSQLKKMQMNKNSLAKEEGNKVVISDYVLKFHEADRREEYRQRFYRKLEELGIS